MDELDKKIIQVMQDDFPLVREPYKEIAGRIGITEETLIERLQLYKKNGQIRKMGAVLQHREVGFSSNVLCAWIVAPERMDEVATELAKHPSVSHCYDRNTMPDWPYNIYTMIHAHSRAECNAIVDGLAKENNLSEKAMLFSVKEWKKTSMRYFCEENMQK